MRATEPPSRADPADAGATATGDPNPAHGAQEPRLRPWLRVLLCCVIPLIYVAPGLLPGHRFLPMAPVAFAPLSLEYPEAAEAARVGQSFATVDRLFPTLTDQLEIRERVWAGESLLWEPDQGLGLSLIGNTISGPFYPPNWLAVLIPPDLAAPFLAWFALTWVALGMWALLARLGNPERACLVAALAVQAAGFGVANLHYGMKVDAVAWLPWCLWAMLGVRRGVPGSAPLLALFLGLPFLAGFPPIAVFATGAAGLYALILFPRGVLTVFGPAAAAFAWALFRDDFDTFKLVLFIAGGLWAVALLILARLPEMEHESPVWGSLRGVSAVLLAFLIGPLLGAIQLLPTLDASSKSFRVPKDPTQLELEALSARTWIGVPLADAYGLPTDPPAPLGSALAWATEDPERSGRTQQAVPLEWNTYAGAATFLLALLGLTTGRRALFPAFLIALSFGFAQAWPGFKLLYHLPGLDGGAPARALSVAWIAWAWLAGLGACALAGPRAWVRGVGAGLGALGLAAGLWLALRELELGTLAADLAARYGVGTAEVERYVPAEQGRALIANLARAGRALALGSGLVLAAALLSRWPHRARFGSAALVGALVLEALLFSRVHVLPRDLGGLPLFPESEVIEAVREAAGDGRVLRLDQSADGISEVIELARPNLLHAYDIADLTPYVAFTPEGVVRSLEAVDPTSRFRSGNSGLHDPALLGHPWLDAAGVSCILSLNPLAHPALEPVLERPRFCVYRRPTAVTGARLLTRARSASDPWAALGEPSYNPQQVASLTERGAWRSMATTDQGILPGFLQSDYLSVPGPELEGPERPAELTPLRWIAPDRLEFDVPPSDVERIAALPVQDLGLSSRQRGWEAAGAVTEPGAIAVDGGLIAFRTPPEGGRVEVRLNATNHRWAARGSLLAAALIAASGAASWRRSRVRP